jgi:hypothetical protein
MHGTCIPIKVGVQGFEIVLGDISSNKFAITGSDKASVLARLVV